MPHALSCIVEHDPHHLISSASYTAAPIDLARLILGARQPKHCPDCLGFPEASGNVDGGAIGQRHHGADPGHRHQPPAHLIGPHDSEQAAMLDDELLAKYAPDDKQRFNQLSQVGQVLDQLLDACLELYLPGYSDLEAEVA